MTIVAPYIWLEWVELSLEGWPSYCGNVVERCGLVTCQSVSPSKLDLILELADAGFMLICLQIPGKGSLGSCSS